MAWSDYVSKDDLSNLAGKVIDAAGDRAASEINPPVMVDQDTDRASTAGQRSSAIAPGAANSANIMIFGVPIDKRAAAVAGVALLLAGVIWAGNKVMG